MLYFLFVSWLILPCVHLEEIVTFQNKEYYLCAVDNTESTIYIEPSSLSDYINSSIFIEDNNSWPSDWLLKSSTQVVVPSVTDKRWEDFGTIYNNIIRFESITSLSFSVKSSSVVVVTSNEENKETKGKNPRNSNSSTDEIIWQHHATNAVNKSAFNLNATAPTDVYWKIHNYKVRYATQVTKNSTVLTIDPKVAFCVTFYMYFCEKCNMAVTIENNIYFLQSKESKWQVTEVNVEQKTQVILAKSTTDGSETGEWILDIRKCSNRVAKKATYKVDLAKDDTFNRTCHTFTSDTTDIPIITQRTSLQTAKTIFECKAGTLGKNCDISCKEYLGVNYTKCEKHKICDESNGISQCWCAWGFQGANCDEECSDGAWGLSCQNKCNNCDKCDKATGACNKNGSKLAYLIKSMLLIPLLPIFKTLNGS